jgi:hypothetical protein
MTFTQDEIKVRSQWLTATFWFFIWFPLIQSVINFFNPKGHFYLFSLPVQLLWFWAIWRCAHEKPGTKLLTFLLVLAPLQLIALVGLLSRRSADLWAYGESLADLALYTWWFILSLKLRRINKRLQLKKKFTAEYKAALQTLESATTLDELEIKFSELIHTWPQCEPATSKAYMDKKSELLKSIP